MTNVIHYAQRFTQLGYAVYPVNIELDSNGAKVVHFKWTPESPGWKHGQYPTDPDAIAEHWRGFEGLAINTERSGLVVVDIDTKKGVDGHRGLGEAQVVLPHSQLMVRSWSGGEHRYYRQGDTPVPSSAGVLARGVDIRAMGGVIFAPPTPVGDSEYSVEHVPYVSDLPVFPEHIAHRLAAVRPAPRPLQEAQPQRELVEHEIRFHDERRDKALAAIAAAQDGDRRAAIAKHGCVVLGTAPLLKADTGECVRLIQKAYVESGGVEWDKHARLISDMIVYVAEDPYRVPPVAAKDPLPEGVTETQRDDYMQLKDRKMLARIADREIRQEEMDRQAARLSLGAPENLAALVSNPPDHPLWLVEDLLHADRLRGLVIGQAKAGKSSFVHNLLSSLTSGDQFLGQFPVNQAVKVGYVDLELGLRLAYEWLAPLPRLQHANVDYYDRVGQGFKLDCRAEGLRRRWAQELADLGVVILVIDPLSPVLSALGISEDSSEVRGLLDSFDALAEMAGMRGVVVCHHAGHSNIDRGRGSSAFNDWFTTRLSLSLQGENGFAAPRRFTAVGRGVRYVEGELVRNVMTGELTLGGREPFAPEVADPFLRYRGEPLTLSEAAEILGQSQDTAKRKLGQFGWQSDGSKGGRGAEAQWRYAPPPDPFGSMDM